MKLKTLSDGTTWARIHWLDVTTMKSWFQNANEVQFCINQTNRYSRMGLVEQFKSRDGYYEFMLTYPSLSSSLYNRWKQTSSPNSEIVSGFTKITETWNSHFGGIHKGKFAKTIYVCDHFTGTWFAPIGQTAPWTSTQYIPAANSSSQTSTELWIRIDNVQCSSCEIYSDRVESFEIIEY